MQEEDRATGAISGKVYKVRQFCFGYLFGYCAESLSAYYLVTNSTMPNLWDLFGGLRSFSDSTPWRRLPQVRRDFIHLSMSNHLKISFSTFFLILRCSSREQHLSWILVCPEHHWF